MSELNINFFGSSAFVVDILSNILEKEDDTLGEVFYSQHKKLLEGAGQKHFKLSDNWLSFDFQKLDDKHKRIFDLSICPNLVVSQPDRFNRNKVVTNPVSKFARERGLRLFTPEKINLQKEGFFKHNKQNSISIIASFGQIIAQQIIDSNSFGFINWHPSLLPTYRGPTPMQTAIYNGDSKTGLSWIEVTSKMDAGSVLLQLETNLVADKTILELQKDMQLFGQNTWSLAIAQQILKIPTLVGLQNEKEVVFCQKLSKDEAICYPQTQTAGEIYNHWRAFLDFPGTVFEDGESFKSLVKIVGCCQATQIASDNIFYQNSLWLQTKEGKTRKIYLKCAQNTYLEINKIRLNSGKEVNLSNFNFS